MSTHATLSQQTQGIESMLPQRQRRWVSIKPISAQCRVFIEMQRLRQLGRHCLLDFTQDAMFEILSDHTT